MARRRERQVIVGLDVGTTKICCVIADWPPAAVSTSSASGVEPSRGLRKGVVVNIDSTVESIKQAVAEAEQMAGVEIVASTRASRAATSAASTAAAWSRSPASTAR